MAKVQGKPMPTSAAHLPVPCTVPSTTPRGSPWQVPSFLGLYNDQAYQGLVAGSQESHVVGVAMGAWADKAGLQPLLSQQCPPES